VIFIVNPDLKEETERRLSQHLRADALRLLFSCRGAFASGRQRCASQCPLPLCRLPPSTCNAAAVLYGLPRTTQRHPTLGHQNGCLWFCSV